MPPRSGAPPQITFCLEYPALNRPASLPPPERQVPGSERSKAPIRRNDEPANHRRPRFRRERRRAASRPVPVARIRREKPSASNLPASNYSASNHPVPTSARPAGTGQRAQQGAYSEARRASKLSQAFSADESAAAQRVARRLPPVRLEHASSSNQLISNRPASLPPPGRQVPGSERSKAPIRRHDEPASFP